MLDSAQRMQSGGPCWPLEFYPRLQVPSLSSYSQFPRFKAILCFHVFARGVLSIQNTCPPWLCLPLKLSSDAMALRTS